MLALRCASYYAHAVPKHAQGCQIGLGALLMLVVGGGSPALAAATPGVAKLLGGAIGLPMVRA